MKLIERDAGPPLPVESSMEHLAPILSRWNGVRLPYAVLQPTSGDLCILGVRPDARHLDVSSADDAVWAYGHPIASDATGNYLVVSASGQVLFWDHDVHKISLAYPSCEAMLAALRDDVPDDAAILDELEALDPGPSRLAVWNTLPVSVQERILGGAAATGMNDVLSAALALGLEGKYMVVNAAAGGHLSTVKLLLDVGQLATEQNGLGDTPLHAAAFAGHLPIIEMLLSLGVPLDTVNMCGHKAERVALLGRHREIANMLRDARERR